MSVDFVNDYRIDLNLGMRSLERTFVIRNDGDIDLNYSVKIGSIISNIVSDYLIKCDLHKNDQLILSKDVPLQEKVLEKDITLKSNEEVRYRLVMYYVGDEQEFSYKANIVVEQNSLDVNLLE